MTGNDSNLCIMGTEESHFQEDIDISNTVDGKPIYYLVNEHDKTIDSSSNAGYVAVVSSSKITVSGLTLGNNRQGILFAFTQDSTIEDVTIEGNSSGIFLFHSSGNTLNGNTVRDNSNGITLLYSDNNALINTTIQNNYLGMVFSFSSNNRVYHNNFINNYYLHIYDGIGNFFDDGYPSGGNYWSDYDTTGEGCLDENEDGFCDTPYYFDGGQDNYPFMEENKWEIKTLHEKAADLAKQLANHPEAYLWGGKGWDYNLAQFVSAENIISGYTYWNPDLVGSYVSRR